MKNWINVWLTLNFLFHVFNLHAQTNITLNPSKDNTLFESLSGDLSNGSGEDLFFGVTNNGEIRRALLRFEIAGNIPAGATITSVSLTISVNRTMSGTANAGLHAVTRDWGEGASISDTNGGGGGAPAETDDATWLNTFFPDETWTSAGGDFTAGASATTSIAGNGNYSWTGGQLISDVQDWLDTPASNFGWIIIGNESTSQTAKRIGSKEVAVSANRPILSVSYTVPCIEPEIPSLTLTESNICSGQSTTLTASGNLNGATEWYVYMDGCGTTPVGSGSDGIFILNPVTTTIYYVRGEGGCATPATCADTTITVNPSDDPSFNFDSDIYCMAGANPSPVITGTVGGTFTSSPAGLVINATSGEIDLAASTPEIEYTITYTTPGPQCPKSTGFPISIIDSYHVSSSAEICSGDQYIFGTQTLTVAGIYSELFQSSIGCDSTVTLTLNVVQPFDESVTAFICEGEIYNLGSQSLTDEGVYSELFQSTAGCDSTVTLTLGINPKFDQNLTLNICEGDEYIFGTQVLNAAGTYFHIFQSSSGCDSSITLILNLDPQFDQIFSAAICDGDHYIFGIDTLTASGTYSKTYPTSAGCDSIWTLNLDAYPEYNDSAALSICNGSSYIFGSQTLTEAGIYSETFTTVSGCDSTVSLTLTVKVLDTSLILDGITLTSVVPEASHQWIDCDQNNLPVEGETGISFTASASGNYAAVMTRDGCMDTSSCHAITIVGLTETAGRSGVSVFPNPSNNFFHIDLKKSYPDIFISLNDVYGRILLERFYQETQVFQLDCSEFQRGIYILRINFSDKTSLIKILKE